VISGATRARSAAGSLATCDEGRAATRSASTLLVSERMKANHPSVISARIGADVGDGGHVDWP
jgi:hypothetical protein